MSSLNSQSEMRSVRDRAAEKQASRDADARALASGEKSREQIVADNSFLPLHAIGAIDFSRVPPAR